MKNIILGRTYFGLSVSYEICRKKYYSNLKNIKFIKFSQKGYFNKNVGVLELREILDYLK